MKAILMTLSLLISIPTFAAPASPRSLMCTWGPFEAAVYRLNLMEDGTYAVTNAVSERVAVLKWNTPTTARGTELKTSGFTFEKRGTGSYLLMAPLDEHAEIGKERLGEIAPFWCDNYSM